MPFSFVTTVTDAGVVSALSSVDYAAYERTTAGAATGDSQAVWTGATVSTTASTRLQSGNNHTYSGSNVGSVIGTTSATNTTITSSASTAGVGYAVGNSYSYSRLYFYETRYFRADATRTLTANSQTSSSSSYSNAGDTSSIAEVVMGETWVTAQRAYTPTRTEIYSSYGTNTGTDGISTATYSWYQEIVTGEAGTFYSRVNSTSRYTISTRDGRSFSWSSYATTFGSSSRSSSVPTAASGSTHTTLQTTTSLTGSGVFAGTTNIVISAETTATEYPFPRRTYSTTYAEQVTTGTTNTNGSPTTTLATRQNTRTSTVSVGGGTSSSTTGWSRQTSTTVSLGWVGSSAKTASAWVAYNSELLMIPTMWTNHTSITALSDGGAIAAQSTIVPAVSLTTSQIYLTFGESTQTIAGLTSSTEATTNDVLSTEAKTYSYLSVNATTQFTSWAWFNSRYSTTLGHTKTDTTTTATVLAGEQTRGYVTIGVLNTYTHRPLASYAAMANKTAGGCETVSVCNTAQTMLTTDIVGITLLSYAIPSTGNSTGSSVWTFTTGLSSCTSSSAATVTHTVKIAPVLLTTSSVALGAEANRKLWGLRHSLSLGHGDSQFSTFTRSYGAVATPGASTYSVEPGVLAVCGDSVAVAGGIDMESVNQYTPGYSLFGTSVQFIGGKTAHSNRSILAHAWSSPFGLAFRKTDIDSTGGTTTATMTINQSQHTEFADAKLALDVFAIPFVGIWSTQAEGLTAGTNAPNTITFQRNPV